MAGSSQLQPVHWVLENLIGAARAHLPCLEAINADDSTID
jgi:hypothetical protein